MTNYLLIPKHLYEGLHRYVCEGVLPGHFLQAVLRNDLHDAVGLADDESFAALRLILMWLYNCTPGTCYGSQDAIDRWLSMDWDHRRQLAGAALRDSGEHNELPGAKSQ